MEPCLVSLAKVGKREGMESLVLVSAAALSEPRGRHTSVVI